MTEALRIGTRRSALALSQTAAVLRVLVRANPGQPFEIVGLTTSGDADQRPGGSPDFTGALELALRAGKIDLAVHSTKDLPARDPADLAIVAYPRRVDPRDCLILRPGIRAGRLPEGARVGSSSVRRRAQLLRARPDLEIVEIRGNVDTRIGLAQGGGLDAVMLAVAGVHRLGRRAEIGQILPVERFLPAPGQGAIAIQARRSNRRLRAMAHPVDHLRTRFAVEAERALAAGLEASCNVPLGALGRVRGTRLELRAEVLSPDGRRTLASRRAGPWTQPSFLGAGLARTLKAMGAKALLDHPD